jgi:hypothetical protein
MVFGPIKKTQGVDSSFFQKIAVDWTTFGGGPGITDGYDGYSPDMCITFTTAGLMLLNLGSGSTNVVEYSFNGTTVHGELNPANASAGMTFDDRVQSLIWFRIQSGSTGPVVVSVQAWAER